MIGGIYPNFEAISFLEFPAEVTVLARRFERGMPNPTLNQIIGNTTLLKDGNSSVPERMSCSDRDSGLLAERLQNIAIHIRAFRIWQGVSIPPHRHGRD
jgi:hypothetical protein